MTLRMVRSNSNRNDNSRRRLRRYRKTRQQLKGLLLNRRQTRVQPKEPINHHHQ